MLHYFHKDPSVTVDEGFLEMEMDPLNRHECMAPLTALLKHMRTNKIIPDVETVDDVKSVPKWMQQVREKLLKVTTPKNVKLFLCKLIVNAEEVKTSQIASVKHIKYCLLLK